MNIKDTLIKDALEEIQGRPEVSDDTLFAEEVIEPEVEEVPRVAEESVTETQASGSVPNVRLSSKKADQALNPGTVAIGRVVLELPSKEEQLKGFYVEDPGTLVGQYNQYKFMQEKGHKVPHTISI